MLNLYINIITIKKIEKDIIRLYTILDYTQLIITKKDLNLQNEKYSKTFDYIALNSY